MDYRFAFVDRPREARLPELDRLSGESFRATQAYPPAGMTLLSIPALTTGQEVNRALPGSASELLLQVSGNGTNLTAWSRLPTVFSEARRIGVNAAIVGWYHPYERLFDASVSYCAWYPAPWFEPARASAFLGTMKRELCSMIGPLNFRFLQLRTFEQTFDASRSVVTNQDFGLVFLHLPIPHKPGIYQPEEKKLTFLGVSGRRGYLGNLLLADHVLGVLRRDMELARIWDSTWVIVSSDHWWRQSMGNTGTIDHRVPFIVKAPDAHSIEYGTAFNTLVSRDLILAIFKGDLATQNQLPPWLDDHHFAPPDSYKAQTETE
jgi:arylsulfatase A-like enzyme